MVSQMATREQSGTTVFRVIDALDHPHGGRILRLKLEEGRVPSPKELRGIRLEATSPDGELRRSATVEGFATFGGKVSESRLKKTGRVDVHVTEEGGEPPIHRKWKVFLPGR